jgi:aryl-alcohol dehydrogenase-like predicted oxidoreductase
MKTRTLGTANVGEIGIGCMYLSITGRPAEADSIRALHAAFDAGVSFLDTADVYCLDDDDIGHNERLIARALEGRRERVLVATKGGLRRPRGAWTRDGRPEHLRAACEKSLRALRIAEIDVYQLHAPDPAVPFAESVGALAQLRAQGKIKEVGLSNVSTAQIEAARAIVPVVSVQNRWNPRDRAPETDGVLDYCTRHGIALLPYSPFGGAGGARGLSGVGTLAAAAEALGVSPHRCVLAWMLARSPVVIPIPGVRRAESARDSAAASEMSLSSDALSRIEASFR